MTTCSWASPARVSSSARTSAISAVSDQFVPTTIVRNIARASLRSRNRPAVAYDTILYDVRDDGVATVTLDSPENRNALSNALLSDLIDAFGSARDDERVRCVVLTSSHETVFSAGGSLDQFAADVPLVHKHFGTERFPRLFKAIMGLGKPTICAANGHVLAGALGLALCCDLVVAKEGVRFGTPEINVGVFPFMIMALVYRNVPRKKTNELLLLGRADLRRGRTRGRNREPCGGGRRVRCRRRRVGRQARVEVPCDDEARQGRHVPPARHALRRRARLPALAALAWHSPPTTSRRASRPSSRSASRSGRADERLPRRALLPDLRPHAGRGARGADAGAADRQAARARAADDRDAGRAAHHQPTTRTCATRAAACSRPAARSTTLSPAAGCR